MEDSGLIKAWQGRVGENVEIGTRVIVADELRKGIDKDLIRKIEGLISQAIAKKLVEDGLIPQGITLDKERDAVYRCDEIYTIIDGLLKPTLLPLAMKMEGLLERAEELLKMKRVSQRRKREWLRRLNQEIRGV